MVRLASGRLQVRPAHRGKLTREAEQAFLLALSATCNVRLAAAAVGASARAFYRRKMRDPAFAREMRMALERGYGRLEMALLESGLAGSHEHGDWRSNEPPAMPPMTVNQALQQMYLHQKQARLTAEPPHIKRRQGESREAHCMRLAAMYEAEEQCRREEFEVAEAERLERGEPAWGPAGEKLRAGLGISEGGEGDLRGLLPDLAQVTGWSNAKDGEAPHDATRALFGGWRLEDMEGTVGEGDGGSRE